MEVVIKKIHGDQPTWDGGKASNTPHSEVYEFVVDGELVLTAYEDEAADDLALWIKDRFGANIVRA